jgi:hypothetical protein
VNRVNFVSLITPLVPSDMGRARVLVVGPDLSSLGNFTGSPAVPPS